MPSGCSGRVGRRSLRVRERPRRLHRGSRSKGEGDPNLRAVPVPVPSSPTTLSGLSSFAPSSFRRSVVPRPPSLPAASSAGRGRSSGASLRLRLGKVPGRPFARTRIDSPAELGRPKRVPPCALRGGVRGRSIPRAWGNPSPRARCAACGGPSGVLERRGSSASTGLRELRGRPSGGGFLGSGLATCSRPLSELRFLGPSGTSAFADPRGGAALSPPSAGPG